jgi:phospholipid/cholesterol/gamma-HCH transport system substrate-binding protein
LDRERFAVIVTFSVEKGIKLSDGTMVSIKTSGLIGDKYISISPGGSGIPLEPGDTIIDTQPPINIQDLISKYAFGEASGGD